MVPVKILLRPFIIFSSIRVSEHAEAESAPRSAKEADEKFADSRKGTATSSQSSLFPDEH
jgi:hypothetical protein